MLQKNVSICIFFFAIVLIACGNSERQQNEEKRNLGNEASAIATRNQKAVIEITHRYNAIADWNTMNNYTYQYQDMFITQHKTISFNGRISDISQEDSTYYLKIHSTATALFKDFIAIVSVSSKKFHEFNTVLQSKNHSNVGCFIFTPTKVTSTLPEIKADIDSDQEDASAFLELDFDQRLIIFRGELIDFYLNETTQTK